MNERGGYISSKWSTEQKYEKGEGGKGGGIVEGISGDERDVHGKSTGGNRHGSQQSRTDTLPEADEAVGGPNGAKSMTHGRVAHPVAKAIGLHLTLDDIKGIAGDPEGFAGEAAIKGHFP